MIKPILPQLKKQYVTEMNAICQSNSVGIVFTENDWMNQLTNNKWTYNTESLHPVKAHLQSLMPDIKVARSDRYFRYFLPERLSELLATDSLQMSSMYANYMNDDKEYMEYFDVLGANYKREQIEKYRETTYILCFTDSPIDKKIWQSYTDNKGVCIEFEMTPKQHKDLWKWEFRKVYYGEDFEFNYLNQIIKYFKNNHNIDIVFPTHKFAQYYKRRAKYSWERESRICIQEEDLRDVKKDFDEIFFHLPRKQQQHSWGLRKYLEVPLDNYFFKLDIKKVYLGKEFSILDNISSIRKLRKRGIPYEQVA